MLYKLVSYVSLEPIELELEVELDENNLVIESNLLGKLIYIGIISPDQRVTFSWSDYGKDCYVLDSSEKEIAFLSKKPKTNTTMSTFLRSNCNTITIM